MKPQNLLIYIFKVEPLRLLICNYRKSHSSLLVVFGILLIFDFCFAIPRKEKPLNRPVCEDILKISKETLLVPTSDPQDLQIQAISLTRDFLSKLRRGLVVVLVENHSQRPWMKIFQEHLHFWKNEIYHIVSSETSDDTLENLMTNLESDFQWMVKPSLLLLRQDQWEALYSSAPLAARLKKILYSVLTVSENDPQQFLRGLPEDFSIHVRHLFVKPEASKIRVALPQNTRDPDHLNPTKEKSKDLNLQDSIEMVHSNAPKIESVEKRTISKSVQFQSGELATTAGDSSVKIARRQVYVPRKIELLEHSEVPFAVLYVRLVNLIRGSSPRVLRERLIARPNLTAYLTSLAKRRDLKVHFLLLFDPDVRAALLKNLPEFVPNEISLRSESDILRQERVEWRDAFKPDSKVLLQMLAVGQDG